MLIIMMMIMMLMTQFVHRGCDDGRPLERQKSTVTGGMLASRYNRNVCDYPPEPSRVFQTRAAVSAHFVPRYLVRRH